MSIVRQRELKALLEPIYRATRAGEKLDQKYPTLSTDNTPVCFSAGIFLDLENLEQELHSNAFGQEAEEIHELALLIAASTTNRELETPLNKLHAFLRSHVALGWFLSPEYPLVVVPVEATVTRWGCLFVSRQIKVLPPNVPEEAPPGWGDMPRPIDFTVKAVAQWLSLMIGLMRRLANDQKNPIQPSKMDEWDDSEGTWRDFGCDDGTEVARNAHWLLDELQSRDLITQNAPPQPTGLLSFNDVVIELRALRDHVQGSEDGPPQVAIPTNPKSKRSAQRGEGRVKLIAALTKHHMYANGSCLNLEHIGNNKLARLADVAKRTASAFFCKEFQGHSKYRALCKDTHRLVAALKALNGEFRPHDFYDARTPDEVEREDE